MKTNFSFSSAVGVFQIYNENVPKGYIRSACSTRKGRLPLVGGKKTVGDDFGCTSNSWFVCFHFCATEGQLRVIVLTMILIQFQKFKSFDARLALIMCYLEVLVQGPVPTSKDGAGSSTAAASAEQPKNKLVRDYLGGDLKLSAFAALTCKFPNRLLQVWSIYLCRLD